MGRPTCCPPAESESTGRYAGDMTDLHVRVPDEVAQRLATEAAQRGTSTEDVAAEVLTLLSPESVNESLAMI